MRRGSHPAWPSVCLVAASSFPPSQGSGTPASHKARVSASPNTGRCPETSEIFSPQILFQKITPLATGRCCRPVLTTKACDGLPACLGRAAVGSGAVGRGSLAMGAAAGLRGDPVSGGVYSNLTLSGKLEFSAFSF